MKLLTILPCFATGGAENMVYELCKQLDKNNVENYIVCYGGKQNTALEQKAEKVAKIIYLNCAGTVNLKNIRCVFRAIDQVNPDVLHAHMGGVLFASLWTIVKRKPLVVTIHTVPQRAFSPKVEKILRLRMLADKFCLVAVSKENKKLADAYFQMRQKCEYVNNGVDLKRFYMLPHKNFTILNVARQDDNKNQKILISVFAILWKENPDIRLILLGDGPNHDALKKQCVELGVAEVVSLPGNISETEKFYAVSDVYVQTSHREAMPLSILEAMASGLPIISTCVGGIKDVVKENGILVPDNDKNKLLSAIKTIMKSNRERKIAYSTESLKIVEGYSSQKMAKEYSKIYRQLLEKE